MVLVFYPGDNTPVCTRQLNSYTADIDQFRAVEAQVLAISPQSVESHDGFSANQGGFAFPLLADVDKEVGEAYGILGPLGFYRRSVFVVDAEGIGPLRPPGGGRALVPAHRRAGRGGSDRIGVGRQASTGRGRGSARLPNACSSSASTPGCRAAATAWWSGRPGAPRAVAAGVLRTDPARTCPSGWPSCRSTCGRCWPSTGPRWWPSSGCCSR